MQFHRARAALCGLALTAALAAQASAESTPQCQHLGAEWEAPKVVNVGATQCATAKFDFTIGTDAFGAQVTLTFHGCPAFIDTQPGHGKSVQRLQKNPIGPVPIPWSRQAYEAYCGNWFNDPSCKPDGPQVTLPVTVDHWSEEACPVITPTPRSRSTPELAPQ